MLYFALFGIHTFTQVTEHNPSSACIASTILKQHICTVYHHIGEITRNTVIMLTFAFFNRLYLHCMFQWP